jgi:hypothetical protein
MCIFCLLVIYMYPHFTDEIKTRRPIIIIMMLSIDSATGTQARDCIAGRVTSASWPMTRIVSGITTETAIWQFFSDIARYQISLSKNRRYRKRFISVSDIADQNHDIAGRNCDIMLISQHSDFSKAISHRHRLFFSDIAHGHRDPSCISRYRPAIFRHIALRQNDIATFQATRRDLQSRNHCHHRRKH